jgi:hypothetical protein
LDDYVAAHSSRRRSVDGAVEGMVTRGRKLTLVGSARVQRNIARITGSNRESGRGIVEDHIVLDPGIVGPRHGSVRRDGEGCSPSVYKERSRSHAERIGCANPTTTTTAAASSAPSTSARPGSVTTAATGRHADHQNQTAK